MQRLSAYMHTIAQWKLENRKPVYDVIFPASVARANAPFSSIIAVAQRSRNTNIVKFYVHAHFLAVSAAAFSSLTVNYFLQCDE
jgi:hypothetical protein